MFLTIIIQNLNYFSFPIENKHFVSSIKAIKVYTGSFRFNAVDYIRVLCNHPYFS